MVEDKVEINAYPVSGCLNDLPATQGLISLLAVDDVCLFAEKCNLLSKNRLK